MNFIRAKIFNKISSLPNLNNVDDIAFENLCKNNNEYIINL